MFDRVLVFSIVNQKSLVLQFLFRFLPLRLVNRVQNRWYFLIVNFGGLRCNLVHLFSFSFFQSSRPFAKIVFVLLVKQFDVPNVTNLGRSCRLTNNRFKANNFLITLILIWLIAWVFTDNFFRQSLGQNLLVSWQKTEHSSDQKTLILYDVDDIKLMYALSITSLNFFLKLTIIAIASAKMIQELRDWILRVTNALVEIIKHSVNKVRYFLFQLQPINFSVLRRKLIQVWYNKMVGVWGRVPTDEDWTYHLQETQKTTNIPHKLENWVDYSLIKLEILIQTDLYSTDYVVVWIYIWMSNVNEILDRKFKVVVKVVLPKLDPISMVLDLVYVNLGREKIGLIGDHISENKLRSVFYRVLVILSLVKTLMTKKHSKSKNWTKVVFHVSLVVRACFVWCYLTRY